MAERIRLSRQKGYRMPPNTVKVDRTSSHWGNPFNSTQVGVVFPVAANRTAPILQLRAPPSLDRCIDLFVVYARTMQRSHPSWLLPLKGKNLACWCPLDHPCHADVLLRLVQEYFPSEPEPLEERHGAV